MSEEYVTPGDFIEGEKIENNNPKKSNAKWIYVGLILVMIWVMFGNKDKQGVTEDTTAKDESPVVEVNNNQNNIEQPVTISAFGEKEVKISESPYQPVADIYTNTRSYNNNTFRLALKGEFKQASLTVKAKTENNLNNFVSLNVGTFSGIYQKDGQDVKFNKDKNFEAVLDLKAGEDFSKKQQDVVLWNRITPQPSKDNATVVRVYATTVDQNGKYSNNSQITEFKINYTCADSDPACEIAVCGDEFSTGGQCLAEKFGADSAKNYIESFR